VATYPEIMAQAKIYKDEGPIPSELIQPLHFESKTASKAKNAQNPAPTQNVGMACINGQKYVLCAGCGTPPSDNQYMSKQKVNAHPHHFCYREIGAPIPPGCRGIFSNYIYKYLHKNWDAVYEESKALYSRDKKAKEESNKRPSPSSSSSSSSSSSTSSPKRARV